MEVRTLPVLFAAPAAQSTVPGHIQVLLRHLVIDFSYGWKRRGLQNLNIALKVTFNPFKVARSVSFNHFGTRVGK